MRPSDWFLVDLPVDPTPGDAFGIRALAQKYGEIAEIAGEASSGVRDARSSGSASAWIGDAAEVFRDRSHRMPGELLKANDSYQTVADALRAWAESVDDTQAQADRGLQQAREAHHDLGAAQAALNAAQNSWTTAHAQQLTYQKLVKQYTNVPVPANVTMPTDYQLRSNDRSAQQAQTSIASAQHAVADADARLAAAKSLVLEAKTRRDDAERRAVHRIHEAKGQAVKPSSIWEAIQDSAAWQAIVVIATVVLTIITIVAIFVGGPLVWALIIAATVLLMVNALMSIAQGKDAWGELILLGIGLIPGGRLLGLAAKGVEALARTGEAGLRIADGIRSVTGVVLRVGDAVTDRVATALASLQRTAEAALPRVTPLVINGVKAAHSALNSFFNPSWLSHFHPGGGTSVAATAAHHAEQLGGFEHDASHAAPGGHGADGAPGHGETTGGGERGETPPGHGETAGDSGSGGGDGGSGDGGSGDGGSGSGGVASGGNSGNPDRWELLPDGASRPQPTTDPIDAAHFSQSGGPDPIYHNDDFVHAHLEPGERFEVGYNGTLPRNGFMKEDPSGPYNGYREGGLTGVLRPGDAHGSNYTGFGFRDGTAASLGHQRDVIWPTAQVKPDDYLGSRTDIVRFQTTTRVDVAEGIALHNPDYGDGGINQIFVPDIIGATHRGEIFPVDAHGNAIPFRVEVNTSTGDLRLLIYATRPQHLIHLH